MRLTLMHLIFLIGIDVITCWRLGVIEIDSIKSFDVLSLTILSAWGMQRTSRGSMRCKPRHPRNWSVIIMRLGTRQGRGIPQVFLWSALIRSGIGIYIIILYDNQVLIALALLARAVFLLAGWVGPSVFGIILMYRTLLWLFINELGITDRFLLFAGFLGNLLP